MATSTGAELAAGEPSDEVLMTAVAAGSRAAFACLTRRHLPRSLALATRVTGNSHDAEEVVQDAFVQVWTHAGRWRGDGARFTTWLYRVIVNRALDYRRRRRFEPLDEAAEVADQNPDAETQACANELAMAADAALAALPERQRTALTLCYHGGLSCAEASEVLKVTVSTMESLLVRGRRGLRARLDSLLRNDGQGDGSESQSKHRPGRRPGRGGETS